jgi:hypothetical protein
MIADVTAGGEAEMNCRSPRRSWRSYRVAPRGPIMPVCGVVAQDLVVMPLWTALCFSARLPAEHIPSHEEKGDGSVFRRLTARIARDA